MINIAGEPGFPVADVSPQPGSRAQSKIVHMWFGNGQGTETCRQEMLQRPELVPSKDQRGYTGGVEKVICDFSQGKN